MELRGELEVDEILLVPPELQHHGVAEERFEVGEHPIDAVAQAARRAAFLVFGEGVDLRSHRWGYRLPFGDAERTQQVGALGLVPLCGQRLGVVGRKLDDGGGYLDRVGHAAHSEHGAECGVAAFAGGTVGREPLRHADVALRVTGGLLGDALVDAGAGDDEPRDVGDLGLT